MKYKRYFSLFSASIMSLIGCAGMASKEISINPNCPSIPKTVFDSWHFDGKLGTSTFGKVVTGDASLKVDQNVINIVSQSVQDDRLTSAMICDRVQRGELKTPEQIDHAWMVVKFFKTNPTPSQADTFFEKNPFPTANAPVPPSPPPSGLFGGRWYGLFREYYPATANKEIVSTETIDLIDDGQGLNITGTSNDPYTHPRNWSVKGFYRGQAKDPVLVLDYKEQDGTQPSVGSIVLTGRPLNGELKGYWLGYDRDREQLVSCPYVLTRNVEFRDVKERNRDLLEMPCYRMKHK